MTEPTATYTHGPTGLLSIPGLGSRRRAGRRWGVRTKANPNYRARAGEVIAGNLARGGDGKFTAAGGGAATKPKPKPTAKPKPKPTAKPTPKPAAKPKPKVAAKPRKARKPRKVTPAQLAKRRAAAAARAAAHQRALARRARGAQRRAAIAKRRAAAEAKRKLQAGIRATPVKRTAKPTKPAAPAKGADRQRALPVREQPKAPKAPTVAAPKTPAAPRPSGGGGGGGKQDKPESELTKRLADAAKRFASGETLSKDEQDELIRNGYAQRKADGSLTLLGPGRKASQKQAGGMMAVFKDAHGAYRWLTVSSTAYRDRDGEIVSTKALADDVARADATGEYGPLRWWHMPGVDIGDCDYNAMCGRSLIESGTFRNSTIAERVAAVAKQLRVSIGYLHPANEPDADGTFHTIRRFERSLLPAGRESNLFTDFVVKETTMPMDELKIKALQAIVGDKGLVDQLVAGVEQREKAADVSGVAFKETKEASLETRIAELEARLKAAEDVTVVEDGDGMDDEAAEDVAYVGDMTVTDLEALITAAITAAMTGKSEEATKETSATAAKVAEVEAALKAAQAQTAALEASLKELQGDQPRGLQARRASQSADTIVGADSALKGAEPSGLEHLAAWLVSA